MNQVLQAEIHSGYKGVTNTPLRAVQTILDSAGAAVVGEYPSLWKVSEAGLWSVCWQNAAKAIVRADSLDNLHTLNFLSGGVPLMNIFSRTGGIPVHIRDRAAACGTLRRRFSADHMRTYSSHGSTRPTTCSALPTALRRK